MTTPPDDRQEDVGRKDRPAMGLYLVALVAGALAVPAMFLLSVAILEKMDSLPPPQFSNSICIDEKLASMRRSPPLDPRLLVVGSSVAWRHFNSPEAIKVQPELAPYNAGFCGADISQTKAITDWLTGHLPSVEEVILIASPVDFENCRGQVENGLFPAGFDITEASQFVFDGASPIPYYLRYFDPWTLWRNVRDIKTRRTDMASFGALVINEFGDGPIEPHDDRRLLYEAPVFDDSCFDALRKIGLDLLDQGIGFRVVVTPLHPGWRRLYDIDGHVTGTLEASIKDALVGTQAKYIKTEQTFDEDAFFDGIHIRWSYTDKFTRSLLAHAGTPG